MKKRLHLMASGRVQGVCYRVNTVARAQELGVMGWVRNLRDGRVEVMAEGEEDALLALLEWCRRGPSLAHVDAVAVAWHSNRGDFTDFVEAPTL